MARSGLESRLAVLRRCPSFMLRKGESTTIQKLFADLVQRGYFIHPIRPWFISYAHDAACIEQTLADVEIAARQAVATMKIRIGSIEEAVDLAKRIPDFSNPYNLNAPDA